MELAYDKEWSVEWEDGTIWFLSWIQEAGSFSAERWSDEATGPCVDTPGPDAGLFEDLETLEAAMGRPLPPAVRQELLNFSERFPMADDMREDWGVSVAFAITRRHPSGEFIDTFAPPGTADPFAIEWLPEWMA